LTISASGAMDYGIVVIPTILNIAISQKWNCLLEKGVQREGNIKPFFFFA
jgi:hypothetical protein